MDTVTNASAQDQATYECMARAIAFIREHHLQQPSLATVARHVHMSEYHFQRLFTQWAGISPKRFCQYLTLDYAKSQITHTQSLLELSMAAGLSSPGRLHDLFITLEAMSPGEYKNAGAGLEIDYGIHNTPFGQCLIAITHRGICNLQFLDDGGGPRPLQTEWPQARICHRPEATAAICRQIFFTPKPSGKRLPLKLHVKGTNFQIQVWRALLTIPWGGLATYQGVAQSIDRPTAARAVGNAIGRNPVGYLIPCHRVIRGSGELGGYRWGASRKAVLLGWEASQKESCGEASAL